MDKELIIKQLKLIKEKKAKAVSERSYEMAALFRNQEKDLKNQIENGTANTKETCQNL